MKSIPLSTTLLLFCSLLASTLAAASPDLEARNTGHDLKRTSEADTRAPSVPAAEPSAEYIIIVSEVAAPSRQDADAQSNVDMGCTMAIDNTEIEIDSNRPPTADGLRTQIKRSAANAADVPTGHGGIHRRSLNSKRAISDVPTGHGGIHRRMSSKRLVSDEAPTGHGGPSSRELKSARRRRAMADIAPTGHGRASGARLPRRLVSDELPTGHGGVNVKGKRELRMSSVHTGHGGMNI
ncbi:hypothetical protein TWF696_004832 [Orbilia brochopaga]|uniref:Uncharacterized protein n=1 Tax=Orbilia brochopaga TaxID=3140254 RepID=A0AAV9V1N0_9PEZI